VNGTPTPAIAMSREWSTRLPLAALTAKLERSLSCVRSAIGYQSWSPMYFGCQSIARYGGFALAALS
jgi:hypothetical protein